MRRRDFIAALGGAVAMPLAAQERTRLVGVLIHATSDEPDMQAQLAAFLQGLERTGWEVGRNVRIETRWSAGDVPRLHKNVADMIALNPNVILAGSGPTLPALLRGTRSVPIVFAQSIDPVGSGSIKGLAQPGGNATGFLQFEFDLSAKWLELLKEVAPQITRVGVFRTFDTSGSAGQWAVIQAFSRAAGVELSLLDYCRHRAQHNGIFALPKQRRDRCGGVAGHDSSRPDHLVGCTAPLANCLSLPLLRHRRRPDLLWARAGRPGGRAF